ncbi:chloride channel [Cladochytrium replicatum]|nr:chloride channel [Cladochytrium replicatum]
MPDQRSRLAFDHARHAAIIRDHMNQAFAEFLGEPRAAPELIQKMKAVESADYFSPDNVNHRQRMRFMKKKHFWYAESLYMILTFLIAITIALVTTIIYYCFGAIGELRYQLAEYIITEDPWTLVPAYLINTSVMIGLATIAGFLTVAAPTASGSGIPAVIAYLNGVRIPEVLSIKTLLAKCFGLICAVSSGLPVGPTGPMVHIGAMLGSIITRGLRKYRERLARSRLHPFHRNSFDADERDFIAIGAGCGIAAALSAPIGGVLFVVEEVSSFFDIDIVKRTFFGAFIAYVIIQLFNVMQHTYTVISQRANNLLCNHKHMGFTDLILYTLIGCLGGLLGALYNGAVIWVTKERSAPKPAAPIQKDYGSPESSKSTDKEKLTPIDDESIALVVSRGPSDSSLAESGIRRRSKGIRLEGVNLGPQTEGLELKNEKPKGNPVKEFFSNPNMKKVQQTVVFALVVSGLQIFLPYLFSCTPLDSRLFLDHPSMCFALTNERQMFEGIAYIAGRGINRTVFNSKDACLKFSREESVESILEKSREETDKAREQQEMQEEADREEIFGSDDDGPPSPTASVLPTNLRPMSAFFSMHSLEEEAPGNRLARRGIAELLGISPRVQSIWDGWSSGLPGVEAVGYVLPIPIPGAYDICTAHDPVDCIKANFTNFGKSTLTLGNGTTSADEDTPALRPITGVPVKVNWAMRYTCPQGYYNPMASLILNPMSRAARLLFLRGAPVILDMPTLLTFLVVFFGLVIWNFRSFIPGGSILPQLLIGATYGRIIGYAGVWLSEGLCTNWIFLPSVALSRANTAEFASNGGSCLTMCGTTPDVSRYALVGAASFWAGVNRLTLFVAMVMTELTDDLAQIPPLIIGVFFAVLVGNRINKGLFQLMILSKGWPYLESHPPIQFETMPVEVAIRTKPIVIPRFVTLAQLLHFLQHGNLPSFTEDSADENKDNPEKSGKPKAFQTFEASHIQRTAALSPGSLYTPGQDESQARKAPLPASGKFVGDCDPPMVDQTKLKEDDNIRKHNGYPVVVAPDDHTLIGFILRDRLERILLHHIQKAGGMKEVVGYKRSGQNDTLEAFMYTLRQRRLQQQALDRERATIGGSVIDSSNYDPLFVLDEIMLQHAQVETSTGESRSIHQQQQHLFRGATSSATAADGNLTAESLLEVNLQDRPPLTVQVRKDVNKMDEEAKSFQAQSPDGDEYLNQLNSLSLFDLSSAKEKYAKAVAEQNAREGPRIGEMVIDLGEHMDLSPLAVQQHSLLARAYYLFRRHGLRHMVVINAENKVMGVLNRQDLLPWTVDGQKSTESTHAGGSGFPKPTFKPNRTWIKSPWKVVGSDDPEEDDMFELNPKGVNEQSQSHLA